LTRPVVGAIMLCLAGCLTPPPPRPTAQLLTHADRLVAQGDFAGAVDAYEDILVAYPDDPLAPRARAGREAAARIVVSRREVDGEIERLRAELAARDAELAAREAALSELRQELTARAGEVSRLQQELSSRQAELQRLAAEADRLRGDLEKLKHLDLKLERRQ
jgi:TolA-binding protein